MERTPIYAYAMRREDGTLVVLNEYEGKRESTIGRIINIGKAMIPVSTSRESIERYGNYLAVIPTAHEILDIQPLLESRVIPKDSVDDIDRSNFPNFAFR